LYCRFLIDYIVAGHKIQNKPLSKLQETSLQSLEEISKNKNNVLSYDLKPNEMVFFDNHRILHGRTAFEDYEDENRKRCYLRTWIKFDSSDTKNNQSTPKNMLTEEETKIIEEQLMKFRYIKDNDKIR
jgi:hypothetical protein